VSRGRPRGLAVGLSVLILFACAPPDAPLPKAPIPAGPGVAVTAEPVPLDPTDPARRRLGNFAYAGGLKLTSDQTARLHGLSDLKLTGGGRFVAVSDEGDLFRARFRLDAAGRLIGLDEASIAPLLGEDGLPLQGKLMADAEGLAVLPGGDMLVSFERNHRIWLYPAKGGPPRAVPKPDAQFPENDGMEALAALPSAGPDAYVVGAEEDDRTWICRLSAACTPGYNLPPRDGAGVVAVAPLGDGRIAWLFRDFNPLTGSLITLKVLDAAGTVLDEMKLARPLTVDNFEGLAADPRADGRARFYLVSDDNFSAAQRTLLLAFDWDPKPQEQHQEELR
jgi:hypothetical protein